MLGLSSGKAKGKNSSQEFIGKQLNIFLAHVICPSKQLLGKL